MPLLAQSHFPIPTKDILSWQYENRHRFDQDKPIFIDTATSESITAKQIYVYIRQLAAGFQALGVEKGDVVCIHSFNQLFYPILVLGILAAGGIFLGTNPSYTAYELEHTIKVSKTKFLIVEPELLSAPKKVSQKLGIPDSSILIFSDSDNAQHRCWRSLLTHGSRDWPSFNDLETAKNTTAFLMFSSGTTGLPKAAQVSHYNLIAQHTLVFENPSHPYDFPVSLLACLPMFHAANAPFAHTTTLRSGYPSHIMRRFEPNAFLDAIAHYKTTTLILVPPMVTALLNTPNASSRLTSVRRAVAGAAPLDATTQTKFQALLPPGSAFTQLWAMTETACVACHFYPSESHLPGAVGHFLPNLSAKLVSPSNPDIEIWPPYNTPGELCVRGPTVIRGYLDNPRANAESWDKEGFFHTGDIAILDEKTKLWYIVDRKKELMKVRGFQVAPAEIEGVLLSHPKVRDAAVVGIIEKDGEEVPRAYVIKHAGEDLSEENIKGWVSGKLAKYKQLAGGVKFVQSIPKTASGKILKRVLRDEARAEEKRKARL